MKVLLLYYTKTGHTLEATNFTADGIKSAGSEVDMVNVKDFTPDILEKYDALIVASPCWTGALRKNRGIAFPLEKALEKLAPDSLKGKLTGGICVHSAAGGENTIRNIGIILGQKGIREYKPGPVGTAGVAFSLWKGPSLKPEDLERFKAFGSEFVS